MLALMGAGSSAHAWTVYDNTCAVPAAPAHVWYIDPVNGSTPDAAHGGVAINGVMGTADGSAAHPYNSLIAASKGGKITPVAGYAWPLLSTATWDHYGTMVEGRAGVGVNGLRRDYDWNPANPDPIRINPGDQIVLESGSYGDISLGGVNVDASGATSFVQIAADAGATPVFNTLGIAGSRGFAVSGVTVKSTLGQGTPNGSSLVYLTGSHALPQNDIIVSGTIETYANKADADADFAARGAAAASDAPYQRVLALGASPEQAFLYDKLRKGMVIAGDDGAIGADNHCVSVSNSHVTWVGTVGVITQSGKILVANNVIDHFGEDGFDLSNTSNVTISGNTQTDPINPGDQSHPDNVQFGAGGTTTFTNIVIDRNTFIERTDASNPWPQQMTGFQHTNYQILSGLTYTNNRIEVSNCPGIALGGTTINSLVANNTVVGNGVSPGVGCPAPQSGESPGSSGNTWTNNVVAGRFYQACNSSVWSHNYQIPSRAGGVSTPGALGYCDTATNTVKIASGPGVYNGVTVDNTNSATFAFQHYDPPLNGVTSLSDPDLRPTAGGPLWGAGVSGPGIPTVNVLGLPNYPMIQPPTPPAVTVAITGSVANPASGAMNGSFSSPTGSLTGTVDGSSMGSLPVPFAGSMTFTPPKPALVPGNPDIGAF